MREKGGAEQENGRERKRKGEVGMERVRKDPNAYHNHLRNEEEETENCRRKRKCSGKKKIYIRKGISKEEEGGVHKNMGKNKINHNKKSNEKVEQHKQEKNNQRPVNNGVHTRRVEEGRSMGGRGRGQPGLRVH